ncbi:MAG TPA: hypothetical protein VFY40_24260 [Blastocatellia bacterium]|nr:hypothetical protein [Blastocatellia bacterium]
MTKDVPHLNQTRSRFDHIGCRIVPQVMPLEISNACQFHKRAETASQPFVRLPGLGIEEQILRLFFFSPGDETGDRLVSNFIQRNPTGFPTLSFVE